MKNTDNNTTNNYNFGEIITPFNNKGQQWDHPIGAKRENAKFWRTGFFCLTSLCVIFSVLFITMLHTKTHTIFVAQLTNKGLVRNVAPLNSKLVPQQKLNKYLKIKIGQQWTKTPNTKKLMTNGTSE